jgi:radical SAM protein with 4Fe4S-binding SPASM domain
MPVVCGCYCGWTGISVLADGTVLGCRRLPLSVGKLPEQSFEKVFLGSKLLRKFRRRASFAECGSCDMYKYCRGCPAYAYSVTGSPFAANPICFRSRISRRRCGKPDTSRDPHLDAGIADEYRFVTNRFSLTQTERVRRLLKDLNLQRVFLELIASARNRRSFVADPGGYSASVGAALTDEAKVFLMQHFTRSSAEMEADQSDAELAAIAVDNMLRQETRTGKTGLQRLMIRAWEDDAYRRALLKSPRSLIERTLDVSLPSHLKIHVHQQEPDSLHIVLPEQPPKRRQARRARRRKRI